MEYVSGNYRDMLSKILALTGRFRNFLKIVTATGEFTLEMLKARLR